MTARGQLVAPCYAPDGRLAEARALVRAGRIRDAAAFLAVLGHDSGGAGLGPTDRSLMLALNVECLLAQGDVTTAVAVSEQLVALSDEPTLGAAIALYSRGDVASALGEAEPATERFLASGVADDGGFVPWRAGAALAMLPLGRRREALVLAHEHLDAVRAGPAYERATALRVLATTEPDGRVQRLREAQVLLATSDAERLRIQVDTDLAGQLVLDGGGAEAVALLRRAETYADREGLLPLQSRVRRLLDRLGEAPCQVEVEALQALSTAERRVALLALDGCTNRQIAEQLLVSVKAVERHLSKIYRKLGVVSRAGLAASLRPPD